MFYVKQCMFTHACTHACTYARTHTSTHAYMHPHIHIYWKYFGLVKVLSGILKAWICTNNFYMIGKLQEAVCS